MVHADGTNSTGAGRRPVGRRMRGAVPGTAAALGLAFALVLGGMAVVAGASSARAQQGLTLVVLAAQGVGFSPGDVIPADQVVDLTGGQTISLIAPSGRIVELTGPYSGVPMPQASAHDADVIDSLKGLIRERMADTGDMGAIRIARVELPDPWVVDVNSSGRRCLRAAAPVVLWRADAAQDVPVTLATHDGSWKAHATWPAGEPRLLAPEALPVADGDRLSVAFPGGAADLAVQVLPASLPTDAARLAWMIQVGCNDQAASLARRLP